MRLASSSPVTPRRQDLPPAAPLPRVLQTLACRLRPLEYLEWCRIQLGSRFTIHPIDMPPLVFLSDPQDIRAIITAPLTVLHPGAGAARTAPLFGENSYLLREEEEYLSGRNAILPAFHHRAVRAHSDMIAELADREISSWSADGVIQIHPRLCVLTLTVMLRIVFGGEDPTIEMLRDRLLGMLAVSASPVLQEPRLRHLPCWRGTWRRFVKQRKEVDALVADLIAQRRGAMGSHCDLLEMLLEAQRPDGYPMSDRELRDNLVSVIVAGHETTASTLAWAFQLIAHHPTVHDRLVAEIDEDREEYLTATVNEVIRHRPVFLFAAPRAVARPIEIGGWTYHPPAHLLGCTYLMHHDPALFTDPHEFRPERFLDSHTAARTWLPWGGGRKLCPGRHLALLELKTVLRTTLATWRLLPAHDKPERARWRSAVVAPHAGSKVMLNKRRQGRKHHPHRPIQTIVSRAD